MAIDQEAQRIRRCAEELVLAARSDPAAAAQLVLEIESIAGQYPNALFDAYSQRAKGHLLHIRGSMPEAIQHYRTALSLFEQCHEEVEQARTASTLVGALAPLGEFDEALRLAEQARRIFQQANLEIRAARLDVNVGNLYHRLNRLEEALLRYEGAAAVFENSGDCEAAAGVLINRSVVLMLLYRFDEALEGFLRAHAFSEKHGLKVFATQSEYNRAYLLFLIGDYAQALKLLQIAEAGFRNLGDEIHVAHCRLDRAQILLELNLPEHAFELAGLAESGFRASGLNGDRSRAVLLLGGCLMQLGRTGEAVTYLSTGKHLFEAEGNVIWASMADLEIATALMASGATREAAELAERAAEVFQKEKHSPFSALADALSARVCIERHDPGRALFFLGRCEESLEFHPPACLRYHISYLKGRALELQGRTDEARDCFRVATDSLEFLLSHISVDQVMARFLEDKEDVYERLAGLSGGVREAFQLVDRARTRALTAPWNLQARSIPASDKVRALRESLRSDHVRLFRAGETNADSLFQKIKRSEQKLMQELLEGAFGQEEPPMVSSCSETFELPAQEVLLEYFLHDQNVSVFVVGNGLLERVTLPISTDELQQEVNYTRYGLSGRGDSRREPALRYHLQRLYDALIEPLKPLLRRRIVIIPHRFLCHLPFHVLLGPAGYLAEEYVISCAPSMAAYDLAARKDTPCSGRSLIIGTEAPDLPAISNEVRNVASKLPDCKVAVNKSLEEIRPSLETAAFVHIASHGIFRSDNPAWSLLKLGSDVLTPADMLNLRINADLVTMSACSTGQTYVRGNEVQGFVRAFLQCGVPSVIASLWEVNDHATSMLMSSFYEKTSDSPDIAENLRLAMLDVKNKFGHPHYWGGFILIGRQNLGRSWDSIKNVQRECTDFAENDT
jgi:CHAT domain-containing protein/tetratricopeptide (TPR) repeat protein